MRDKGEGDARSRREKGENGRDKGEGDARSRREKGLNGRDRGEGNARSRMKKKLNGRDKGEGNVRSRKEKGGEKEGERYLLSVPKHYIYLEFLSRLRRIVAKARRTYVANFVVCDGVGVINN